MCTGAWDATSPLSSTFATAPGPPRCCRYALGPANFSFPEDVGYLVLAQDPLPYLQPPIHSGIFSLQGVATPWAELTLTLLTHTKASSHLLPGPSRCSVVWPSWVPPEVLEVPYLVEQ